MKPARRLARDKRGNVSIAFAGALSMLLATASLSIDAGLAFVAKRKLQGATDAAAMAAAADPAHGRAVAEAVLRANGIPDATVTELQTGSYVADPARAVAQRFVPGSGDAVRLVVSGRSRTYIAGALGLGSDINFVARATAAHTAYAGIAIGSRLAEVDGGPATRWLGMLAGTDLHLTVLDYRALAGGQIDILRFSEALRSELRLDGGTFDDALAAQATWPQVVRAMAAAVDRADSAAVLRAMAGRLPPTPVEVGRIIDLGPYGAMVKAAEPSPVAADTLAMLRAVLELGGGARQLIGDLDIGVPGVASVRTKVAVGDRPAHSPWLAIGATGAVVRTTQVRVLLETQVAGGLPAGLGTLRIPILIEIAPAEARLDEIACSRTDKRIALTVTPSLGQAAIADFDENAFGALERALTLRPATLVRAPLVTVTGFASLALGSQAQRVSFDKADIEQHRVKTVETTDVSRSLASSLARRATFRVETLGFGFDSSAVTASVAAAMQAIAPALDQLTVRTGDVVGAGVGEADVWAQGVRCGVPTLVG